MPPIKIKIIIGAFILGIVLFTLGMYYRSSKNSVTAEQPYEKAK